MKNFKKTIISISTFALVMAATLSPNSCPISKINPIVPISASAAEVSEDGWEYDISADGVTITGYIGEAKELSIPSTLGGSPVRHIANGAFFDNTSLESVKIPEGVKSIGNSAFQECTNLNKISLPSSLEFIENSAFRYTSLEDVVIPANVKSIGNLSFYQIKSLKTVTIKGNTIVDDDAFGYSESIEHIKFNYNYRFNFTKAFKKCVNLHDINNLDILNEEEHRINTRYLDIIKNLEDNTYVKKYINEYVPDKVSEDWEYSICNCEVTITKYKGTDKELHIPSTIGGLPVRHIADDAFYFNDSLESVEIPEGVKSIGISVFEFCHNLNKISLPSSLEFIENYAFEDTSLEDIVIPANVTSIGSDSFSQIKTLKTVTIMGNTAVDDEAFRYSESIESIKFNYNYRSNFTTAFKYCVNLHDINDIDILNEEEHRINTRYLDIIKNLEDNKYVNKYVQDEAKRIVNEVANDNMNMTDVQKAKALHDWICDKVKYDHDAKDARKNHIEGSIFLYNTTVCEGYARGYNLLLNLAGIESYYVYSDGCSTTNGETHAWNIVKLGDYYFHIDVCWDDGYQDYRWYMNSDTEVNAYGGAKEKWRAENAEATPRCDFALGDVNKRDGVNDEDYDALRDYLENKPGSEISESDKVLADLNFNGVIDKDDLELLYYLIEFKLMPEDM